MARDLLPLAVCFDEGVRGDDGVRPELTHDQHVVGALVGGDGRIAVDADLEFGKLLAVGLEVGGVAHQPHDLGFGVEGSIAVAPVPILCQDLLIKSRIAGQVGFDGIILQLRDGAGDASGSRGLRLGFTQPCEQGNGKIETWAQGAPRPEPQWANSSLPATGFQWASGVR